MSGNQIVNICDNHESRPRVGIHGCRKSTILSLILQICSRSVLIYNKFLDFVYVWKSNSKYLRRPRIPTLACILTSLHIVLTLQQCCEDQVGLAQDGGRHRRPHLCRLPIRALDRRDCEEGPSRSAEERLTRRSEGNIAALVDNEDISKQCT